MLTWVYSYGFRPARWVMARKVAVCSFGEHEQTTTPSSFLSRISWITACCAASEQANIWTWVETTIPSFAASARTFSVST